MDRGVETGGEVGGGVATGEAAGTGNAVAVGSTTVGTDVRDSCIPQLHSTQATRSTIPPSFLLIWTPRSKRVQPKQIPPYRGYRHTLSEGVTGFYPDYIGT